jgi:hypothetical protein
MPYSKSLRVIGQSIESFALDAFVVEKRGKDFAVRSDSLPHKPNLSLKRTLDEKIWHSPGPERKRTLLPGDDGWLLYRPPYLSWLDAQGRRRRRRRFAVHRGSKTISQLLRTLGRHLDRVDTNHFQICWADGSVVIEYEVADGSHVRESLSINKLHELSVRMRLRRAPRR